jgi:hypothetical protein
MRQLKSFHPPLKFVILSSVNEQAFRVPFAPGFGVNGQSLRVGPKDLVLEALINQSHSSKLSHYP